MSVWQGMVERRMQGPSINMKEIKLEAPLLIFLSFGRYSIVNRYLLRSDIGTIVQMSIPSRLSSSNLIRIRIRYIIYARLIAAASRLVNIDIARGLAGLLQVLSAETRVSCAPSTALFLSPRVGFPF